MLDTIRQEIRELKPSRTDLRRFGLLVGTVLAAIGVWCWARQKPFFPWLLGPGVVLVVLGAALPGWLRPVYRVWMSMAIVLGFLVSNLLLILLFVLVITPIGLLSRIAGKDFLSQKLNSSGGSWWIVRSRSTRSKADYEKQY